MILRKIIMLNKTEGIKRKRGGSKKRWRDCMKGDFKRLRMINWRRMVLERNDWKLLMQTKTYPGL